MKGERKTKEEKQKNKSAKKLIKASKKKGSLKLRRAERINTSAFMGLSLEQVEDRKKNNLTNKKILDKTKSYTKIFLQNIFNFCNTLIIVLCIMLIAMGHWDYTISSLIIFINIGIGIYQEVKAKWTVQKLSLVKVSSCDVVRGGNVYNIPVEELVLDDVFVLSAGQQIPVDGVVLDGSIEVDESILTGESEGVKKTTDGKVLSGSFVLSGEAAIRAERVGKDCYIESISSAARMVKKPESKLFDSIDKIIKIFSCILTVLAVFLFISYQVAEKSLDETLLMTISSMLGMIPCGMFLVTSTALAQSVLKLAKKNALPQDIYSVEMLAMVDTLLLDKTGTITDGNLEVIEYFEINNQEINFRDVIRSLDDANKDKKPTAMALNKYCENGQVLEYTDALAFSSVRKYSAITIDEYTYLLGAPDFICPKDQKVSSICSDAAQEGKRTILLAKFEGGIDDIDIEKTIPIGIFVLQEQLKEDVKEILAWFKENDVDIKIISGDNPVTVSAIAQKAGVFNADKYINCAELTDEELREVCSSITVFGRVSPEQKVLIVEELKKQKHIVGMIGDGVNDVKALKASNCSISFGNANEAARNTSRIVLLDNNFKSMPYIVKEGRRVISNIEKVSSLFVMKNIFVMAMTFIFSIVLICTKNIGYPFTSKQMLMIEFFVIGIPPFIFALLPNQERSKGNFMRNVANVSIPSALSILFSCCFVYAIGVGGKLSIDSMDYSISMATLAMTFAGFICAFFVALPKNTIRILTLVASFILALMAAFIDHAFLKGTFIDVTLPTDILDILVVASSVIVAFIINICANKCIKSFNAKYGDKLVQDALVVSEKAKEILDKKIKKLKHSPNKNLSK